LGRHHSKGSSDRGTAPVPNPFKLPPPQAGLRNPSYLVRGRHGAVATEAEICSTIGIDVLKENGTATDAAIASALCGGYYLSEMLDSQMTKSHMSTVGTINMFSSGIGGGGFLIIRPPNDPLDEQRKKKHSPHHKIPIPHPDTHPISIDFRETSPSGSHPNMYVKLDATASKIGGLSVGVPGELRGFEEAYKRYGGGVSWERIFEPSIKLAEKGWHVTAELDRRLRVRTYLPESASIYSLFACASSLAASCPTFLNGKRSSHPKANF
jgi:gamma-glutamyltranspeptidase/glutathione hydrolase/leukotriene-C4 hydrolase